ncbi:MAG: FAD-dependent oxidoreductase [Pseudonocardiaceae bacterium]|nr:FAD-dependent oxidoreductase [Pseudonocardiaceae bacterium]
MPHAVVVGGGIGGLSTAVGLHRIGWRVTVLEQASAFAEIGAGITLWPNALRALEALGLHAQVRDLGAPQRSGGMRTGTGRWLLHMDGESLARRLGRPMLGVHRASLHTALLEALPPDALHAGVRIGELTEDGTVPGLDLPPADLVVGADGINSRIRAQYWPDHPGPSYSGITSWRAICRRDEHTEIATSWCMGREFGIVPLVDGRIYWYGAMPAPEGARDADEHAFVREHFAWHSPIPELIDATPAADVLRHDIRYLRTPLGSYVHGNVALLGDAAHAMTPHLGQGGCQALEDAAVLVAACARFGTVTEALRHYDAERRPRSQQIARASYWSGRLGPQLVNPFAVALRNAGMRLIPQRAVARNLTRVCSWTPPRITLP